MGDLHVPLAAIGPLEREAVAGGEDGVAVVARRGGRERGIDPERIRRKVVERQLAGKLEMVGKPPQPIP